VTGASALLPPAFKCLIAATTSSALAFDPVSSATDDRLVPGLGFQNERWCARVVIDADMVDELGRTGLNPRFLGDVSAGAQLSAEEREHSIEEKDARVVLKKRLGPRAGIWVDGTRRLLARDSIEQLLDPCPECIFGEASVHWMSSGSR
jgi:hypothetical protein